MTNRFLSGLFHRHSPIYEPAKSNDVVELNTTTTSTLELSSNSNEYQHRSLSMFDKPRSSSILGNDHHRIVIFNCFNNIERPCKTFQWDYNIDDFIFSNQGGITINPSTSYMLVGTKEKERTQKYFRVNWTESYDMYQQPHKWMVENKGNIEPVIVFGLNVTEETIRACFDKFPFYSKDFSLPDNLNSIDKIITELKAEKERDQKWKELKQKIDEKAKLKQDEEQKKKDDEIKRLDEEKRQREEQWKREVAEKKQKEEEEQRKKDEAERQQEKQREQDWLDLCISSTSSPDQIKILLELRKQILELHKQNLELQKTIEEMKRK